MAKRYFHPLSRDSRLRGSEAELSVAECTALTGGNQEEERIVVSDACADISRAAFTALSAEEIARATSLDELCDRIGRLELDLPDFHIEVMKIPKSLPEGSIEIQERVGKVLPDYPDLVHPKNKLVVVRTERGFRLGRIGSEARTNWRASTKLPQSYSRSIPARVARAMVNLAACPGERLLDPCCGAATIPIQALLVGIDADASDINPKVVEAANANLAACGYAPAARSADARQCEGRWDAVVTDLPYGWFGHESERRSCDAIVRRLAMLAPRVVVATASEEHGSLLRSVLRKVETIRLPVSKKGTRYIHVGEM